jgi:uncharacterized membrane protein
MKYSFIDGRKKQLISAELGLVLAFFGVIFFVLIFIFIFLELKISHYADERVGFEHHTHKMKEQIEVIDDETELIKSERAKAGEIHSDNLYIQRAIYNLFDLIPDKITLSKAEMQGDRIILYGTTPSKDVYNLLLLAPLRSIFDKTYTSFYLLNSGWYRFVSYNYFDKNTTIFRNR